MLFWRSEGTRVKNPPTLRRLMPHLLPTRNESVVYFEQRVDLSRTLRFIDERKEGDRKTVTLFEIILAAAVRTLAERPQLNRFVAGRHLYDRDGIQMSFAVKKQFTDEAKLTTVKVRFEPDDGLEAVGQRVKEAIGVGKGEKDTASEKEMKLVTLLPRFLLRFLMWAQRGLDYWSLLPGSMIRSDPLYASMFLANLGSVGLDTAYHHLFEYGTTPLFATIGRVKKAPIVDQQSGEMSVRDVVDIRYSFDERIADGFYAARALELFRDYVEDPARLPG